MSLLLNWVLPLVLGGFFLAVYTQLCVVYGRGTSEPEPCNRKHRDDL